MYEEWEWFCGTNSSDLKADLSVWITNTCFINGLTVIPHVTFIVVSVIVLLLDVLVCRESKKTTYLLRYPGHNIRWFVGLLSLIILAACIGEGVLTDATHRSWQPDASTRVHYYLPGVVAFVAVLLSLMYYHYMELRQRPSMSILLLCYWSLALVGEGLHLANLKRQSLIDFYILRFDLTLIMLVAYAILFLTELNLIRIKVFRCNRSSGQMPVHEDLQNPNMHFMEEYVNLLSKSTYWWLNWMFLKGYKKPLDQEDLGDIPERHSAKYQHKKFNEAFEQELARAERENTKPSMIRVYANTYRSSLIVSVILKFIADALNIVGPLTIGAVTAYVVTITYSRDTEQVLPHYVTFDEFFANGFVLAATLFFVLIVRILIYNLHFLITFLDGGDARAAIQVMVFKKALSLATFTTSGGHMTMGQITNHMSVDAYNVFMLMPMWHFVWSAPFQIIVILILLYFEIGFSALAGASLFLVIVPIQFKIAAILAKKQKAILACSDKRLKKTNELLQGIKLLKMYAWEHMFCKAIEDARKKEMHYLLHINLLNIATVFITFGSPILVTLIAFATYAPITGEPLTPEITFSTLAFFNLLGIPLFTLPLSLTSIMSAVVSSKRIMKFLLASEVEEGCGTPSEKHHYVMKKKDHVGSDRAVYKQNEVYIELELNESSQSSIGVQADMDEVESYTNHILPSEGTRLSEPFPKITSKCQTAIKITDGNFVWDPESTTMTLSDINVEIPQGKLTIVIGQVGSGKSSLLSAILHEMTTHSGHVHMNEGNDQIAYAAQKPWLLNESMRNNILFSAKYDKKRYNTVLNACALQPDIDILPAGDRTEIGEKGINLSGGQKQRVSVARAVYSNRDIIILDDPLSALDVHVGRQLFEEGIMKLLVNNNKTVILVTHQLQYLNRAHLIVEMKDGRIVAKGNLDDITNADPEMYQEIQQVSAMGWDNAHAESTEDERVRLKRSVSVVSANTEIEDGKLIEKEEMVRGAVSYKTYLYLIRNISWGLVFLIVLTVAMQSTFTVVTNFWLSDWSESGLSNQTSRSAGQYVGGYAGLSIAAAVSQFLATASVILSMMIAAKRLHLRMLRNITHAPLRFFDVTLIGRILNRFTSDTQLLDFRLPHGYNGFIISIMQCLASVVVVSIVMPVFLVFVVPIFVVYYLLQVFYLATSRELQRLESTSKSPVFACFSETLGGLSTIRAYRSENVFFQSILSRIDNNMSAFLYAQLSARWLAVRLDGLGSVFVLFAIISTLIGVFSFGIDASLVGLSATYSLQLSSYLNYLMRNRVEVEIQMNSVERIQFYSDVAIEDYSGTTPSGNWPHKGEIRIEHIWVRYAEGLDAVLKDISVILKAGEKVGICGRTGSGKSSLTLGLLRVIDVYEGKIFIDDVDIKSVPLTFLRSQISIIPQDPVLFAGQVRFNLDPEAKVLDEDLWHALEISQLKDAVSQLDGGLDAIVSEGGENFSVGQRQLFCLARAFLRKTQILLMDEATASVDLETDKTLQTVVATAFADRTVLTIAHRIETICNSDKILVLDGGCLAEFGSPKELLADKNGIFTSLVSGE